jgi:hypothetical protein
MHNQQNTSGIINSGAREMEFGPRPSSDYFAFYQVDGRWAWRRVSQSEDIVECSSGTFERYLQCIADARKHGWRGKPVGLCTRSKGGAAAYFENNVSESTD